MSGSTIHCYSVPLLVTLFVTNKSYPVLVQPTQECHLLKRTAINPWNWSVKLGYNQAEVIEDVTRQVICAGQTAVDENGVPQHPNDLRAQIALSLDNLETVLSAADMDLSNVTRLRIYTTDIEEALKSFDLLGTRFGEKRSAPPMTLVGVTSLAIPGLDFEIEASAAN